MRPSLDPGLFPKALCDRIAKLARGWNQTPQDQRECSALLDTLKAHLRPHKAAQAANEGFIEGDTSYRRRFMRIPTDRQATRLKNLR